MSQKKGFGNLTKKVETKKDLEKEEKKIEIPKEIIKEQELFQNTSEKEMILTIKEKLSFLQGNTEKSLEELSRRLCVKEELQKAYLNKNFKAVKEYFSKPLSKTDKKPIFSNLISSKMDNLSSTSQEPVDVDFEDDQFEDFEVSEEDIKTNQKIKIKLVIVEISHTKKEQNIRKFLSPLASLTGQSPQFGMFHSALVVGPWYLEWSNKSLCIPKKIYSTSAILALDVPSTLETANVDDIIDKISDVVCRWNVFHNYDRNKNNCQVFIEELLLCLGIQPDLFYQGQLGEVLKKMRTKGECDVKFKLDHDIQELVGIKENKIQFKTHQEIDKFMIKLDAACVQKFGKAYSEKCPSDFALLKSIDRAFWLRYYREKNNEEYCPCKDGQKLICPFGDPINTKTFAGQDWF